MISASERKAVSAFPFFFKLALIPFPSEFYSVVFMLR